MKRSKTLVLASVLVMVASPGLAGGMMVKPGKWEFKATSRMPMAPAPRTSIETQCLNDSEIKPETFMKDAQGCEMKDPESDASSMKWKMACASPGGQMNGQASFKSTGSTVRGTMTMVMSFNGQQMTLEHEWEGKRIGPCD